MDVLLILAGSSAAPTPDVIEAGRVMAELDDWRAILFAALVLCGLMFSGLMGVVFMAFRSWTKNAEALAAVREAISATNIVIARIESVMGERRDE